MTEIEIKIAAGVDDFLVFFDFYNSYSNVKFLFFKLGTQSQPAEGWLWAHTWLLEIGLQGFQHFQQFRTNRIVLMHSMCVFVVDLSGTCVMVVDTHTMTQTAVHLTKFFNRDSSIAYFTSRTAKYSKHACAASLLCISLEILKML